MESMNEFFNALAEKVPNNISCNVTCEIRRHRDGKPKVYYQAASVDGNNEWRISDDCTSPESAINDLIHQLYPEIEPVQTDILLPKVGE
jgi:hypothetical protein